MIIFTRRPTVWRPSATPQDLKKLVRFPVRESVWQEQFKALEIIAEELKGKAYFIDTVFDAWQTLNRCLVAENLKPLMARATDDVLEALDRVADNLIEYSKTAIEIGAAGIFLSIPAGDEIVTREEFLTFVKPFAQKVSGCRCASGQVDHPACPRQGTIF